MASPARPPSTQSMSAREQVELALNLNRIYGIVASYPQISEVPNVFVVPRDEVIAGYERIKANPHLGPMCEEGEHRVRVDNALAINMLCELIEGRG